MRRYATLLLIALTPLLAGWESAWADLRSTPHECDYRADLAIPGVLGQHKCGVLRLTPHDAKAAAERVIAIHPHLVWVDTEWSTDGISVWRRASARGLTVRFALSFVTWSVTGVRVTVYGPSFGK
jgi:hypothetical protein